MTEEQKLLARNAGLGNQVLHMRESAKTWRRLAQLSGIMNIFFVIAIIAALYYPIIECIAR